MAVLWNPGKGFFHCTLFKEEITKLSWFRSLLWTLWDGSEPPKTAPSCDPSYPRAQQTLESGIHETPLQEGSCAHHGIHAPGAAQISLGAGVWNVPPGMSLPPVVRVGSAFSSQQGDLPGSGISQQRSSINSTSTSTKNMD